MSIVLMRSVHDTFFRWSEGLELEQANTEVAQQVVEMVRKG